MRTSDTDNDKTQCELLDRFLGAFFGDTEEIFLRFFKAKAAPDLPSNKASKRSTTREDLRNDPAVLAGLHEWNLEQGVFFSANSGGTTNASINRINAFFAESDHGGKEVQNKILDSLPLKPSIRVETLRSIHAYWLLDQGECRVDEFGPFQLRLISYLTGVGFQADTTIKEPSRAMRLPYFSHLSVGETGELARLEVKLVEFEPDRRYTLAAMREAFAGADNSRFDVPTISKELPAQIRDGEGRTREMVSYAGTLNRKGLTPQEMFESMQIVNRRFVPPLTDEKLQEIVDSIFKCDSADPIGSTRKQEKNTDLGNARRLVRLHGADLRYDSARKLWLTWGGDRWAADSEDEVMRRAKEVPAAIISEAQSLSESFREAQHKHAKRSESAASLTNMIKLGKSEREIAASIDDFDRALYLLNCANGTLDLRTGKLQEHRREDMITKIVPIDYDANATAPLFEKFLDRIFAGNRSLIDFMQRVFRSVRLIRHEVVAYIQQQLKAAQRKI
jgi:hypothetical protein